MYAILFAQQVPPSLSAFVAFNFDPHTWADGLRTEVATKPTEFPLFAVASKHRLFTRVRGELHVTQGD